MTKPAGLLEVPDREGWYVSPPHHVTTPDRHDAELTLHWFPPGTEEATTFVVTIPAEPPLTRDELLILARLRIDEFDTYRES